MRKSTILAMLCVCLSVAAFAQKKTIDTTIYCPTDIEVTLFFESPIMYFEGEGEDENYSYVVDEESWHYVYITGLQEGMPDLKAKVKTKELVTYNITIVNSYEETVTYEFYEVFKQSEIQDSVTISYNIKQKKIDSLVAAIQTTRIEKIMANNATGFRTVGEITSKIMFALQNIMVFNNRGKENDKGKELYFVLNIKNDSGIDYEIGHFFVSIKTKTKSGMVTAGAQQNELVPSKYTSELGVVEAKQFKKVVLAMPMFTISDEQLYEIHMVEKEGNRQLKFAITAEDINKATSITFD